jgi:outer membrane protein assembly factor BamD
MKRFIIIGIIGSFLFTGCSYLNWLFPPKSEERPAGELISDGMEAFEDGKYKVAISNFEQLKDWYPFSKYAKLAELKMADAYFYSKEYDQAVFAYEEFESLHPRNEAIPYVVYQIGRSYFEQVDTIDRDQTVAKKSLETFERLIRTYPNSEYAKRAFSHRTQCYKILAGHELYVGLYYYKGKHYRAALNRFKSVLTTYPDVGVHQKALVLTAACEATLRTEKEADKDGKTDSASWKFWERYGNAWKFW